MTRILLTIASSEYDDNEHLSTLNGVINDGLGIHEKLIDPDYGEYNKDISKILISPTLNEVRNALENMLFDTNEIECFTFYFAGHGTSHLGTYYLCLKNTDVNKLSATALPINHIFNIINEKLPLQTNIIIDACEAGGVVNDLNSLIKPEVFGNASSPSVSLFGACMRDQGAEEYPNPNACGVATNELLKYISGEISIDSKWPFLDVVQIGRNVSSALKNKGFEQTAVSWGLNLTGFSTFCKNPNFRATDDFNNDSGSMLNFLSDDFSLIKDEKEIIWSYYLNIHKSGATPELLISLVQIVNQLKDKQITVAKIGAFLIGTSEGLTSRVLESEDAFAEVEILATCCAAFLPILNEDSAHQTFIELINRLLSRASKIISSLEVELKNNPNALLSPHSLLGDLFYLPIRISKLLGWIGLLKKIQDVFNMDLSLSDKQILSILGCLSENYSSSFVCVSDSQAPYLLLYSQLTNYFKIQLSSLHPIKNYINDFLQYKGHITYYNIPNEKILTYLLRRNLNQFEDAADLISRPTELLSVLLYCIESANLSTELNHPSFIKIDHLPLNIFLPDDSLSFCSEIIENGVNITMEIGADVGKGIFKIEDFNQIYINDCIPRIKDLQNNCSKESLIGMALFSFIIPNRVPWSINSV